MKFGLLLATVLGLFVVSGPVIMPDPQVQAEAPAWLMIPEGEPVASVELTGAPGAELSSGNVELRYSGDGMEPLDRLRATYARYGYVVTPLHRGMDNLMGSLDVTLAVDPMTGRSVTLTRVERLDGSLLALTFKDPLRAL